MSKGCVRRPGGGRKESYADIGRKVYQWWLHNQDASNIMIREKALEFSDDPNFMASNGWITKFKKKYLSMN